MEGKIRNNRQKRVEARRAGVWPDEKETIHERLPSKDKGRPHLMVLLTNTLCWEKSKTIFDF